MKIIYYPLMALMLTACLQANEINDAHLEGMVKLLMTNKPLPQKDQRQLAIISLHHYQQLKKKLLVIKLGGSDAASKSASDALLKLKNQIEREVGSATFGAETIWFLMIDKEKYSSLPMISKIEPNSPASIAGLKPGDVIDSCDGIPIKGEDSRNNFTRMIRLWPKNTAMKLQIRRSQHTVLKNPSVKAFKHALTLTLK